MFPDNTNPIIPYGQAHDGRVKGITINLSFFQVSNFSPGVTIDHRLSRRTHPKRVAPTFGITLPNIKNCPRLA